MIFRSIIIKPEFILEKGWPEAWINTIRLVREIKQDKYGVGFTSQDGTKKIRWIPKDKIDYISPESVESAQEIEEVFCPQNVLSFITNFSEIFEEDFKSPSILPGRNLQVDSVELVQHYQGDYIAYVIKGKKIPACCFRHLPPKPFDPSNIDSFIKRFNLQNFRDKLKDWSTIVIGTSDGKFITKEYYKGIEKFTIRQSNRFRTEISLVSEFGEFQNEIDAKQALERLKT